MARTQRSRPALQVARDASESCLFPEGITILLHGALRGTRVLSMQLGGPPSAPELLELLRPARFVESEVALGSGAFSIDERAAAFEGVFLIGLLPIFVDRGKNLFD